MSKALELAKFGREAAPTGLVVGDSDAQTLSSKTFSDMPVFSGGTVNTVPYLNASKVLSSSTTLAFDGTNLGVGVASPGFRLDVGGGDGTNIAIRSTGTADAVLRGYVNGAESGTVRFINGGGIRFETAGGFKAQLNSSGYLSLGTTSAPEVLTVHNSNYEIFGLYRNLDYNSVGAMGVRMYFGGYVGSTPTRSAAIDGTLMTATTGRMSFSNLIGGVLTESLRIETNGSVRIGGTFAAQASSAEKLTVDGGTSQAATLANTSDSYGTLYLKNKSNTAATIQPYLYFTDADGGNRSGFGVKITDASLHHYAQGGINWYVGSAGFSGLVARLSSSQLTMFAGKTLAVENPAGGRYGLFGTDSQGTFLSSHNGFGEPLTLNAPSSTAYMNFKVAGADRIIINSSGYTTIGNLESTNPNKGLLNIVTSPGTACGISFADSQGGSRGRLWWSGGTSGVNLYNDDNSPLCFGTTGTEKMRITYDGKVGIATTDPRNPLHVADSRNYTHSTTADHTTNMAGIRVTNTNNGDNWSGIWFATGSELGTHWSGIAGARTNAASNWGTHLSFFTHEDNTVNVTQATERVRIDSAGRLGIGVTNPTYPLTVNGPPKMVNSGFNFNSIDKDASSGTVTFTYGEVGGGYMDNMSAFILIHIYLATSAVPGKSGIWLGTRQAYRGAGGSVTQISVSKENISTLTVATSGDSTVVTCDGGANLRCRLTVLAGGGTQVPAY